MKNEGIFCKKPSARKLERYDTEKACKSKEKACIQLGDFGFVGECQEFERRAGVDICIAECPEGWFDEGDECSREDGVLVQDQVFAWKLEDE